MSKHCEFCGRFFVPDHRVGNRQRACSRPDCKAARKQASQKKWVSREPGYFLGRYPYVKEWRQKRRDKKLEVIQDERPPAKPLLRARVPGDMVNISELRKRLKEEQAK